MAANGYLGTVTAGSGTSYTMDVTQDGLTTESKTVVAMNATADTEIDPGYQAVVVKIGNTYYFAAPVWL